MADDAFYLPENPGYTILDSLHDSVRFARRCLTDEDGWLRPTSSFVDPDGVPQLWHDFGPLVGPGWAANAVGGAFELLRYARLSGRDEVAGEALRLVDWVLDFGFVDEATGLIRGYYHTVERRFALNYQAHDLWFCPGSMARIADQFLRLADLLPADDRRADRLRVIAARCGRWLAERLAPAAAGWFPRRCAPDGTSYPLNAYGHPDRFAETSADGLFILDLWRRLTLLDAADYRDRLTTAAEAYVAAGGWFASINHDTYDAHESVAYACAFRTFRRLARLLGRPALAAFAHDVALAGLRRFEMDDDRHGLPTRGLLWMEESWDTAYLWENAEAATAYLEAYQDTRDPAWRRRSLTVLRAIAQWHHGPHGFLTEGVDWNNHVGAEHHHDGAEYGAIRYTEPLLNNLHHAEATLTWVALGLAD